ncbi:MULTISPECIES: hypothetical protein [Bacillus cereus group]|jgi:hypothetical protein|uniref:Uncharacterized protein n=4 Tax=Bacillus thuringiensis TaxID=1428 RepID=A0A9W4AIX3_BACTO|nr:MULTISPECIES: hypothetical protein [Bacillus cereus group]AFV53177.1 hypothetical protein [Bacillus thuringiensis serovar aizawai]AGE81750.1 hypothetical protein HD73_8026 [Bacillus thuringiensis serovar kurstaki str. HD73]AGG04361.1 hypothetical protein H175_11p04 [Bacillus thuringiensis serovar thuringiensis str. IS5056]AHZ55109.1 hypothetical protein YBT1520_34061 [Bacillus thuringiensis serovar kurstaki str. YBT-1520]AIM34341.1 hypothetical protein DF16_pBMB11orf00017 [Bacillus thuringi
MQLMKVMLTGCKKVDFTNDNNERIEGVNIHFLTTTDNSEQSGFGYLPSKVFFRKEFIEKFSSLNYPIVAEAIIAFNMSPRGIQTKISDFNILEEFPFTALK